ncbi:MAG: fatty acyl-AMP ligase [Pseudomonadota bacterium]
MTAPAPSQSGLARRTGDFPRLVEALDYAATGEGGFSFYASRGKLDEVAGWASIRERALVVAGRLRARGLVPGDRVVILAETSARFVVALLGTMYAGLVPCPAPLPAAFGARQEYDAQLSQMIEGVDCRAVIAPGMFADWVEEAFGARGLLFAGALDALDNAPDPVGGTPVDEDALAYIHFTSGTTRRPKGVQITHRAMMANIRAMAAGVGGFREDDRGCFWLPLYHDMGLIGGLMLPMACQVSVDMMSTRDFTVRPGLWTEIISRNRGTISYAPSFGYHLAVRRAKPSADLDLSCWRIAGIGGDMVQARALDDFAETFGPSGFRRDAFAPSYGMAELTLGLCFTPPERGAAFETLDAERLINTREAVVPANGARVARLARCGPPLAEHRIQIRDAQDSVLPEGQVGRIIAHGPGLMRGYYGEAEETARVLGPDGWLDTGDLGYLVEGELVITGRAKDMIAVNGRNVWPQDIEWSLQNRVEGLRASGVAVFGDPDALGDIDTARITIILECGIRDESRRAEIKREAHSIAREVHGIDADVVLCGARALPRTTSGKLRRSEARRMLKAGEFAD